MPNPFPFEAHLATQRKRQQASADDLDNALKALRVAIEKNKGLLEHPGSPPEVIQRSTHAMSQAIAVLLRALEVGALHERLAHMESKFDGSKPRLVAKA